MKQILLDGHNNPGFSGGPVIVTGKDPSKNEIKVIAVIAAYLNQSKIIKSPVGDLVNDENSGIVISYSINHVNEIIKANPVA